MYFGRISGDQQRLYRASVGKTSCISEVIETNSNSNTERSRWLKKKPSRPSSTISTGLSGCEDIELKPLSDKRTLASSKWEPSQ